MYLNEGGMGSLFGLDLVTLTATSVSITGATGVVFDWAVNPADGLLYGGDNTGGPLAVLNPAAGTRTDLALAGLPSGSSFYGAAWFDAAGTLFLYRNNGTIYEVDVSGPTLLATRTGPSSIHNDGAACINDLIGAAKDMSASSPGLVIPSVEIPTLGQWGLLFLAFSLGALALRRMRRR